MSGDYSRQRFDPQAAFAGVLMQQGRVQLDADWNELVELLDRRLRAETVDLMSPGPNPTHAGVALVPRQTPDAFKISAAANTLTIGRGRMYVDGLLAENYGVGKQEFDPLLAESHGTADVAYEQQPYHPHPPALPEGGPHLAYLDVWQREVTALELPNLVEIAVGVDTTNRLQTVWQVRMLAKVGSGVSCATPDTQIPGWLDIVRPSSGRLSTAAVGVKPEDDPCELPPTGGYRGLENQLYRVEIHDGGKIGQATFKWSRDNASVGSRVVAVVSPTELQLASLGRDSVLRFHTDDWVEIIDDWREMSGEDGDPGKRRGEIRKITVDEDATTISFAPALPSDMIPTGTGNDTLERRNLRVRRWDHKGKVRDAADQEWFDLDGATSHGVIPVPAATTSIVLENGVQITFTLAEDDGVLRSGDYWLFAARTADASVEELVEAPPRGIHHHFARLAVVTFPDSETDCRTLWPPAADGEGCDCSVCVTPESHASGALTIQKAIDQVTGTGGTVCLGAGIYLLRETPLHVIGAESVRIRGQGPKTMLVAPEAVMRVSDCTALAVEDLSMISLGAGDEPVLLLSNSTAVRIERLTITAQKRESLNGVAIGLGGAIVSVTVRENHIVAAVGIARAIVGDADHLTTALLAIEGNRLWCARSAVRLDETSFHLAETRICNNDIQGCTDGALVVTGATPPGIGIEIGCNALVVAGDGIVVGIDGARIDANEIRTAEREGRRQDAGIVLVRGLDEGGVDRCQILSNRITGLGGPGIAVRTAVRSCIVKQNIIEGTGDGIVFEDGGTADTISIENNQLLDIAPQTDDRESAPVAIRVIHAQTVGIVGNTVRGVGQRAAVALRRSGVQVVGCAVAQITGNDVSDVAPPDEFLNVAAGIEIVRPYGRADVSGNVVRRHSTPVDTPNKDVWLAIAMDAPDDRPVRRLSAKLSIVAVEDRHVLLTGLAAFVLNARPEVLTVHGNLLEARGGAPVAQLAARGDCVIADNHCLQTVESGEPAVRAFAATLIANANRVFGGEFAMVLDVNPRRATVLGNVTRGPIMLGGVPLAAPWDALNAVA